MWSIEVLIFVVITTRTSLIEAEKGGENNGCSAVKLAWNSKGLDPSHVASSTTKGEHLQVCAKTSWTCCTVEMEAKLLLLSRQDLNRTLSNQITEIRQNFVTQTIKYDGFCSELIDKASRDLHQMFLKTYGVIYEQNSKIFSELFQNLKLYYKGQDLNLEDVLENFFETLMQHMFQLLNTNYAFNAQYLHCVTENMDELKPFGDVPGKLSTQVRRAFIGARTFHQGLVVGREVISTVSKLDVTQSCVKAVAKLLWCPYCQGFMRLKPCQGFCLNVMKGCLVEYYELHEVWNTYIDWLTKLAERLEGPFNIESVVDPIDVKISDAIMNFQEKNEEVSKKVFLGCGQPSLATRNKRQADDDMTFDWKPSGGRQGAARPTTAAGTNIDRLMQEFREKLAPLKDLWKELPQSMCKNFTATEETKCWNGTNKNRYTQQLVDDGIANQRSNPEVDVDDGRPSALIEQQKLHLTMIIEKLKKAFSGHDVNYYDLGDADGVQQSSGSGDDFENSGSGDDGKVRARGEVEFSSSLRPPIKTFPPYVSSHPQDRERLRTRGRVTPPMSAAAWSCVFELFWLTGLYFWLMIVSRNI